MPWLRVLSGMIRHRAPSSATCRNRFPSLCWEGWRSTSSFQGQKLGDALLRDALKRALSVAADIGARAVLVHAIDQEVVPFYTQYGFKPFPEGELTLFLSITELAAAID